MKKLLILFLVLCTVFSLAACGADSSNTEEGNNSDNGENSAPIEDNSSDVNNEENQTSKDESANEESEEVSKEPDEAAAFTVKVIDQDGNVVEGATVQLCKESCIFQTTNNEGLAFFNNEITDGYKISVLVCPEGYTTEGTPFALNEEGKPSEVYLDSGISEYTIELIKG